MNPTLSLWKRMLGDDAVTSCLHTRRELQRFLDGEAASADAARIARHLGACRACDLQAAAYRAITASLRAQGAPLPAPVLERAVEFAARLPETQ